MRLELGSPVRCSDGNFGEVADVVVDPIVRRVTHLVVQPHNRHGLARLVPVALADGSDHQQSEISLRCTIEEVRRLAPVQEYAYLRLGEFPVSDADWDVGIQDVLAMPSTAPPVSAPTRPSWIRTSGSATTASPEETSRSDAPAA